MAQNKTDVVEEAVRQEIVLHGLRWAQNILSEILMNHAAAVNLKGRGELSEAVSHLNEAEGHFRKLD